MPELGLVMPVYNEAACVRAVVDAWMAICAALSIDVQLYLIDDGSTDGSAEVLDDLAASGRPIEVVHRTNAGHGPSILLGYRRAVATCTWTFQTDSDDELPPASFSSLWERRSEGDAVFGVRTQREQPWTRRLVSAVSRLTVRALFGPSIQDVNVPYRLIRSSVLSRIIAGVPDTVFAPNVIIAGALAAKRCPVVNVPVPHTPRRTGTVSLGGLRLWRQSARALYETLRYTPREF